MIETSRRFLPPLLMMMLLLHPPIAVSTQTSKPLMGNHQIVIINKSSKLLEFSIWTSRGWRRFQLQAGSDLILENVKFIHIAGTQYSLDYKNRYALFWDAQSGRPVVNRLVATKTVPVKYRR